MAYTQGDPVYLPKQNVRRGVAGYKGPAIVVDPKDPQAAKAKPSK